MPENENKYTIQTDLQADPTDYTVNNKCSRCGGCCSSVLPLSGKDIARLKKFVQETGFQPVRHTQRDVVNAKCPFLVPTKTRTRNGAAMSCAAYDKRPAVCRTFICSNTNKLNAKAWLDAHPDEQFPDPKNIWLVFNQTGLRLGGEDIPYDKAPVCRIVDSEKQAYEFHVGRPVSLELEDHEYVPPSLVIGIYENGLHIFHAMKHAMEFVPFDKIQKILSRECYVDNVEDF